MLMLHILLRIGFIILKKSLVVILEFLNPRKNNLRKIMTESAEDLNSESVEVLRERLSSMKRLMAERNSQQSSPASTEEIWSRSRRTSTGIIDGNFLSVAFGGALLVIVTVSVYAFYNLYNAILKKFPSHHEEL